MKTRTVKTQYDLSADGIDLLSEWLDARLTQLGVQTRPRMRIRLLTEEILLRMRLRIAETTPVEISIERRFGSFSLRIGIEGESFNPLSETGNALGDWNSSLITAVEIDPKYAYIRGENVLRIPLPRKRHNPVVVICAFILLGILLGLACSYLLRPEQKDALSQGLYAPVFEVWMRILNALSGLVIFFMGITSILNTKRISKQGGTAAATICRYFLLSILCAVFSLVFALPFFPPAEFRVPFGEFVQYAVSTVQSLFPENPIDPFLKSDTPQLLLIAFLAGTAILTLGNRVPELKRIIRQFNMVGLQLAKWISALVPLFICTFLTFEIMTRQTETLAMMWEPLLLSLFAALLILMITVLLFSLRMRANPFLMIKKLSGEFLLVLKNGSLDDAFEDTTRACARKLGVDAEYARAGLPQGMVLYMPISVPGVLIFTMFAARAYGTPLSVTELAGTVLFSVILFVATPPVPGANLLAYTVLFARIGIPGEALADAMIFDVLFGIVAAAGNLSMLEMETVIQAKRIGLLRAETLRSSTERNKKRK